MRREWWARARRKMARMARDREVFSASRRVGVPVGGLFSRRRPSGHAGASQAPALEASSEADVPSDSNSAVGRASKLPIVRRYPLHKHALFNGQQAHSGVHTS